MTYLLNKYDEVDKLAATTLRMLATDAVQRANSGHPGLPLGTADIVTVLWTRYLKHNPADPTWFNRDRFILSAGHGSALLYALLHLSGYPLPLKELKEFRQYGSLTPGHPEYNPEIGIETTTGPLGQGLGNGVGIALAERLLAARFNKYSVPLVDHHTYVLASDGDLMEGVSHEVASLAGHLGLNRLIVFFDDNGISIDGPTDLTCSDDVIKRFEAYNWHVQQVDGHNMPALDNAVRAAREENERPSIIACRTHIGYGSPRQDMSKVHGAPLGEEDLRSTKENLDWPVDSPFFVPASVKKRFGKLAENGKLKQAEWEEMLVKYRTDFPKSAAQWDLMMEGKLALDWESVLPEFSKGKTMATRAASGEVLNTLAEHTPTLIGGSADLTPSNNTRPSDVKAVRAGDFSGSYIHYGIREHAMGAIMNGLALHRLRPYGGTFLVFSDYMRPAIRLAAMMELPIIYVFTHDSIGLGEDGPTHQPVEQMTALRVIPNLVVMRPADGNETSAAWKTALERKDGPTALILSRQGLPITTPEKNEIVKRGAYVLSDAHESKPDVVLIATGSEVNLVMAAKEELNKAGIAARVVSMPSWELFEAQTDEYKASVLPTDTPRLAVETGVSLAWPRYLCHHGRMAETVTEAVIGLDRFGASAPYQVVFEKTGFTVENIVARAKLILRG